MVCSNASVSLEQIGDPVVRKLGQSALFSSDAVAVMGMVPSVSRWTCRRAVEAVSVGVVIASATGSIDARNALDARSRLGHSVAHTPRTFGKEAPMNTVVRARIDQATKDEATVILDTIGLTVSDAFRLMMRRIVAETRLPFDPLVPNATTLAAIDDANRGDLDTVDSVEDLFATLRDGRDDD